MKYVLIGLAVCLIIGFGIQFIKAGVTDVRIWWAKKHADQDDQWMYE
jgi:hypothetical protein